MQIHATMKMAEVIHMNYHLLQVISRFGINLGFGEKSIQLICKENSINVDLFLQIINSYHHTNYFPEKHHKEFPLTLIIDYLRKSHEYYLHTKIPQIASLLDQLTTLNPGSANASLQLINKFFNEYKQELASHIQREEDKVYPYIFAVEKAFTQKIHDPLIVERIRQYSMDDFENEHDNVEDKLFDLKNILIKYLPAPVNSDMSQVILVELFRLESDLQDHARIEDKVLIPKVKYMEKWIIENFSA